MIQPQLFSDVNPDQQTDTPAVPVEQQPHNMRIDGTARYAPSTSSAETDIAVSRPGNVVSIEPTMFRSQAFREAFRSRHPSAGRPVIDKSQPIFGLPESKDRIYHRRRNLYGKPGEDQ